MGSEIPASTIRLPRPVPAHRDNPEAAGPTGPGPLPPPGNRAVTRAALVALGVLIAVGAVAWLGGGRLVPGGPALRRPSAPVRSAVARRSSPARPGQPSATPGRSPVPSRSGAAVPAGRPGIVSISPVLAHRAVARQIAALLDSYFDAVNRHQYIEYSSLFEPHHQLTAEQFRTGYRSTHDSHAVLTGLAAADHGLTATVTFQSHQEPASSPDHAACTNWRITLYLRRTGAVYLIGPPPAGYRASYHACGPGPASHQLLPS